MDEDAQTLRINLLGIESNGKVDFIAEQRYASSSAGFGFSKKYVEHNMIARLRNRMWALGQ
jgi:hypothetical protein